MCLLHTIQFLSVHNLRVISLSFVLMLGIFGAFTFVPFRANALTANNSCTSGFALTPAGCVSVSCVHLLPPNVLSIVSRHGGSTVVTFSNGKSATFPPCSAGPSFSTNGWVEDAQFVHVAKQFSGNWNVPQAPSTNDGQTIFMFIGTEDAMHPGNDIIQPVLQWGSSAAGGGPYWSLASWFVSGSSYYVSTLINVNAGDSLKGILTSNHCTSGGCDWVITGKDITSGTKTTLLYTGDDVQNHAYVTLEVYNVASCSDYPSSGHTTFTNLQFNGGKVKPAWTPYILQNDGCGESVHSSGSTTVALHY
jgi:hypothetical protein